MSTPPDRLNIQSEPVVPFLSVARYSIRTVATAPSGPGRVEVTIPIKEGEQTRVARVLVEGGGDVARSELDAAIVLRSGRPFSFLQAEEGRTALTQIFTRRGHLYARVEDEEDFQDAQDGVSRVDVRYRIQPGPLVRVGYVEAYTWPMGATMHWLREVARRSPGYLTRIGLGTYIDPRHGGGYLFSEDGGPSRSLALGSQPRVPSRSSADCSCDRFAGSRSFSPPRIATADPGPKKCLRSVRSPGATKYQMELRAGASRGS